MWGEDEITEITKEEARASIKDMKETMKYFDSICEKCNKKMSDCMCIIDKE